VRPAQSLRFQPVDILAPPALQYGPYMQRWESFAIALDADTDDTLIPVRDEIGAGDHAKHTTYARIPQLNQFGNKAGN
jgi:hypothetical protein